MINFLIIFLPLVLPMIVVLYFLPGFVFTRVIRGLQRNNPFFWILLSLMFNGPFYSVLAISGRVSLFWWLFTEAVVFLVFLLITRRLELNFLSDNTLQGNGKRIAGWIIPGLLIFFFLVVTATKAGIALKRTPIVADDYWQLPKIVSVAASPSVPKHFYFPPVNLSYYYYRHVSPGLLTRFSGNLSTANRSFFLDAVLRLAAVLYLIFWISKTVFANFSGRLGFVLPLTFFGGFEFLAGFLAGEKDLFNKHLEYWPGVTLLKGLPEISNFATYNIWVPQHLFAASLVFFIYLIVFKSSGSRFLKSFFTALTLASTLGFSLLAGIPVFIGFLVFTTYEIIRSNREELTGRIPALFLSVLLSLPFFLIIGWRRTDFSISLTKINFWAGGGIIPGGLNFLATLPVYFFLNLGILFIGLIFSFFVFLKLREKVNREQAFWLIFSLPVWILLFIKFSQKYDFDFSIRSRMITVSLLSLAVFTGLALERIRSRWLVAAIFGLYSLTAFSPISEIVQNLRATPRGYTYFLQIDQKIPLNSIIFAEKKAVLDIWQIPIFIHRMTVKENRDFEMTDFQYIGSDTAPSDGLDGTDLDSLNSFLRRHPDLKNDYNIYYLSKGGLNLPLVSQDLDYRLYLVSKTDARVL